MAAGIPDKDRDEGLGVKRATLGFWWSPVRGRYGVLAMPSGYHEAPDERFARELPSPVDEHPLDALLTDRRQRLYRQVLARRCVGLAVVVEDCHDPHNATAVLRSCDAFGIHRVHVAVGRSAFKVNRRVSQGAHRYLDLHVHEGLSGAYAALRADGYRIFVSDLARDAVAGPQELRAAQAAGPIAVVFGSEGFGVSAEASAEADGHFLIPMAGFSQSLNLSVSVATTLYALRGDALAADAPGDMSAEQQRACYDRWVRMQHPRAAENLLDAPDPRAHLATGKRGEELEVYGGESGSW